MLWLWIYSKNMSLLFLGDNFFEFFQNFHERYTTSKFIFGLICIAYKFVWSIELDIFPLIFFLDQLLWRNKLASTYEFSAKYCKNLTRNWWNLDAIYHSNIPKKRSSISFSINSICFNSLKEHWVQQWIILEFHYILKYWICINVLRNTKNLWKTNSATT